MTKRAARGRVSGGLMVMLATGLGAQTQPATRHSAEFLRLVPDPAAVVKLSTGHRFVEGPTWLPGEGGDGGLVFSDIPKSQQHVLALGSTADGKTPAATTRSFRAESYQTNGTALDLEGRLVVCQGGARNVGRVERDGRVTVLADKFEGKRFNSPNDVTVGRDGAIYFTDPRYGRFKPGDLEMDHFGVYRIAPGGAVTEVVAKGDVVKPNGIALSPDDSVLYVADTDAKPRPVIRAFKLAGGMAAEGREFYRVPAGVPDGIRVDADGNVWSSAGDGVHVISPAGALIGIIKVPEVPANLAFGGKEGHTLFITARTGVYAVETRAKGSH